MKVLKRASVRWALLTIPTIVYAVHGWGTKSSVYRTLGVLEGPHDVKGVMRIILLGIIWLPLGSIGYGIWRLTGVRKALNPPPATPEKHASVVKP